MEELQNVFRSAVSKSEDDAISLLARISSTFDKAKASLNSSVSSSAPDPLPIEPPPQLLLSRPPRHVVSLLTCSKLCAVFFVAGVFVGYTLKRRVRRWAANLLRRIKNE